MVIGLQAGIDLANSRPCWVIATISMHDASGDRVLFGRAAPTVRPDVPLLSAPARFGGLRRFRWIQAPGFSTRGDQPISQTADQLANQLLVSARLSGPPQSPQPFRYDQPISIDFSVRRDPGLPFLTLFGGGPSIQVEIELLNPPGPGVTLNTVEDGVLLRAVGRSLLDQTLDASYTVTLDVIPQFQPG